jgi:hypothetical protein
VREVECLSRATIGTTHSVRGTRALSYCERSRQLTIFPFFELGELQNCFNKICSSKASEFIESIRHLLFVSRYTNVV